MVCMLEKKEKKREEEREKERMREKKRRRERGRKGWRKGGRKTDLISFTLKHPEDIFIVSWDWKGVNKDVRRKNIN